MGANTFGTHFRVTTWGESHGPAIGVVIDGCPAGVEICDETINAALSKRAPGRSPYTSPRKESDCAEILSGLFEGKTTGAPISIMIRNHDADSSKYHPIKNLARPGHANVPYLAKYGHVDWRGGGRASARETACRVAAGAVAARLLEKQGVSISAYLLDEETILKRLDRLMEEGDSIGGIIEFTVVGVPIGIGEPIYNKVEALLAYAMMSIPATKGFEIGSGFRCASMQGSEHNDSWKMEKGEMKTSTNHSGGVLGGVSTGMPIMGRVAFKPTSSIGKAQETVTLDGETAIFKLPEGSRHDPCVAIRAVPVVKAMASLVTIDLLLAANISKKMSVNIAVD